jgi:hypothetical protein
MSTRVVYGYFAVQNQITRQTGAKMVTNDSRWPTLRTAIIVAAMIATISLCLVSAYRPGMGIIWNLLNIGIAYEPSCYATGNATPCGGAIPYRLILAATILFVGAVALKQRPKG